jgi:hypothetical protein
LETPDPRPLVLHGSWRGRIFAAVSPVLLCSLGTFGLVLGGWHLWPLSLLVVGVVLAAVVVFDYPLWVVIAEAGIERRCLLRSQRLVWDEMTMLARPAYSGWLRGLGRGPSTGLVAEIGRRRYLLTDRMESRAEYETLLRLIGIWARGTRVEATLPPDDSPPTWLYKRRRGPNEGGLVDQL